MSEQNKEIARRFITAFASGDTGTLKQIVAEDAVDHNLAPGSKPGRPGLLEAVDAFQKGFPDLRISVDRLVAEGDFVAVNGKITGMNTGPLMGAAPSGKRADFSYMDMYRIANGQIVDMWHVEDIAAMVQQLKT